MSEMNERIDAIRHRFVQRARTARALAYAVLVMILVTLAGGMWFVWFAGDIVSAEALAAQKSAFDEIGLFVRDRAPAATALLEDLRAVTSDTHALGSRTRAALEAQANAAVEIAEAAKEFRLSVKDGMSEKTARAIDDIVATLSRPEILSNVTLASNRLGHVMSSLQEASGELAGLSQNASQALDKFLSQEASRSTSLPVLASALATRIGALLMLIFLVQILINLYRYNIRLSAFFDARADALDLCRSDRFANTSLIELMTSLSPDNLDFGKSPPSPAQHAIDLAREIISRRPK